MAVKERVASLLEEQQGKYLSGEEIAHMLGITRAAVWKAVNSLKDAGYSIEAMTNKGYRLSDKNDVLSAAGIEKFLGQFKNNLNITVLKAVTSTNTLLKEKASAGAAEGTIIISSMQTEGRGRFARKFHSPSDSGIYMSILIKPDMSASDATLITTAAAVAVSDAVETVSGRKAGIKWVNDILIDSKKVCGILTEASLNIESGNLDYAVVGIGLNAYEPEGGFPDEIKNIAGPIFTKRSSDLRNELTAEVIKNFFEYYKTLNEKTFLESYRNHCIVFGKKINVIRRDVSTSATAINIDDDCRLLVRYSDGKEEYLSSGEISIRL